MPQGCQPGRYHDAEQGQADEATVGKCLKIVVVRVTPADRGAASVRLHMVEAWPEVARLLASGGKSVEPETGQRIAQADLGCAGEELPVLAGGEVLQLHRREPDEALVGRRE